MSLPSSSPVMNVRPAPGLLNQFQRLLQQQEVVASILAVCVASISMTVFNKFVVSGAKFTMIMLLLGVQGIVCSCAVLMAQRSGAIELRRFTYAEARSWAPISLSLVTVMWTGSKALRFLSVPVYTIFKNMTIILIAYSECTWFGGSVSRGELVSFFLMVVSSLIAASSSLIEMIFPDPSASLPDASSGAGRIGGDHAIGYFWVILNCLATTGYILLMRARIKTTGFSDWETMFLNNLMSIPVVLVGSIVLEGWSAENFAANFPSGSRFFLITAMVLSGLIAVFISYASAWCIRVTSSTTYSMIGALNKLPVAVSGMLFFGDPVTFRSVTAVLLGFAAGLLYTKSKQAATEEKKRREAGYSPVVPREEPLPELSIPLKSREDGASPELERRGSVQRLSS